MAETINDKEKPPIVETEIKSESVTIPMPFLLKKEDTVDIKPSADGTFLNANAAREKSNFILDAGAYETKEGMIKGAEAVTDGLQKFKNSEANEWVKTGLTTVPVLAPLANQYDKLLSGVVGSASEISSILKSDRESLVNSELNDFKRKYKNEDNLPRQFLLKNTPKVEVEKSLKKENQFEFKFKGVAGQIIHEKDFLANMGLSFFVTRASKYKLEANNPVVYKNCTVFENFPYMMHLQDFYFDFPKKRMTKESYAGIEISKPFNAVEGGNSFGFNMFMDEELVLYKEFSKMVGSFFSEDGKQQIYNHMSSDTFIDLYVIVPAGNGESVIETNQDLNSTRFIDIFILESIKLVKISNPLKFTHSNGSLTFNSKVSGVCNRISLLTDLALIAPAGAGSGERKPGPIPVPSNQIV